jgi:predicted nucleic-acid-binding protein
MNYANNDFVGETADFEYATTIINHSATISIVQSDNDTLHIPVSSLYSGYFFLISPGKGHIKVYEDNISIEINKDDNTITGNGSNQFGSFEIKGKISIDGNVILFKEYLSNNKSTRKRSISSVIDTSTTPSSREMPARIRKPSSLIKMYEEEEAVLFNERKSASEKKVSNSTETKKTNYNVTPKASNVSIIMNNCSELLKDVMNHSSAVYFLEPVDYIKLEIPDYPNIIKQPMDLGTIFKKINTKKYDPDSFASDVRLVFKNALKFNNKPDHFVHIAAKELSAYFEDLFRPIFAAYAMDLTAVDPYQSKSNLSFRQENSADYLVKVNDNDPGPRHKIDHLGQTIDDNIEIIKTMRSKLNDFESKLTFIDIPLHDEIDMTDDIMTQISAYANYEKKVLIDIITGGRASTNDMDIDDDNSINVLYANCDDYTKKLIISSFI